MAVAMGLRKARGSRGWKVKNSTAFVEITLARPMRRKKTAPEGAAW
jgi:hypothetical protein